MRTGWAIDLGNTHTRIARWDRELDNPQLVELPDICRRVDPHDADGPDPLEAPRLIPSATHVLEDLSFWDHVGAWSLVERRMFLGRRALIGRAAWEANAGRLHPNFASTFKIPLEREPGRVWARAGPRAYTVRQVAGLFVRELLAEIQRATGHRLREVGISVPVDAYETYRAEVQRIARDLGIWKLRFVDEPVAAALGYGLGLVGRRLVLVVDFGGGTLHMALASLTARGTEEGHSRILAKAARPIGGGLVDRWVLREALQRLGLSCEEDPVDDDAGFWFRQMLMESRRVKEGVYFFPSATFRLNLPAALRHFAPGLPTGEGRVEFTREDLKGLLEKKGLYRALEECLNEIGSGMESGRAEDIEDVLLVGGSTLLPGVYPFFEQRFGRGRVRAWQPFEAVAFGACAYMAGAVKPADFIMHDYAVLTHHPKSHDPQHTVVIPKGTRFPTPSDFWKRQLIPTCAMGEPETVFKLVICEIGRADQFRKFAWDASGGLHKLGPGPQDDQRLVVPLNESNPALGFLDPPHPPSDRRARLEVAFGVNADRWLIATVTDLMTKKRLMDEEPVVRLL